MVVEGGQRKRMVDQGFGGLGSRVGGWPFSRISGNTGLFGLSSVGKTENYSIVRGSSQQNMFYTTILIVTFDIP